MMSLPIGRSWPAVLLLAGLACPAGAGVLVGKAGPFGVQVEVSPDPPVVGANTVKVTVQDGVQPVSGATVGVTAAMTDMNMGSTEFPTTAGEAGVYQASVNLSMAGGWALTVRVEQGGRQGSETFRITTGNPVRQVSAGGRRAVWLWLLVMIGAPLLVALLPARWLPRERRAAVAGTLLLIAAVFFARAVVQTYKRPGQMTVVESQAMDMTAMKPPVGLVPVVVETARLETFRGGVSYTGSVVPFAQQDVYPRVTGMIVDMPVYPGDHVRRGQVVVRLDTSELGSRRSEAVLAHLAAQDAAGAARQEARSAAAGVDQARSEYTMAEQRIKQMTAERASAEAMVRRSQQELAAAQARVRQAERSVEAGQASQRTAVAMSEESRAMVHAAEAEQTSAGSMITEATEELNAARREVAEAEKMIEAAQAGQERAEANAAAMRAELPQAQADVAQMQADLTYAQQQFDRMAALLKEGAVSQQEYDEQKSMRDQAQARLERAQAMVTSTQGKIRSEEAMARQSTAEVAAARERRAKAEAMVRAAQARVTQSQSGLTGSGAMVAQREAGVRRRAAEEEEAASMVAMRRAEVETMSADVKAAEEAVTQARQEVAKAEAGIAEMRAERERAAGMIRERTAMTSAANQRAGEMANRAGQASAAAFTAGTIAGYTEIRATVDGVVIERVTSPATLVQPGMLLLRIAQIDQVRLQTNVAQADAETIRPGAPVEVTPRKAADRHDTTLVSAVFPASNPASRTQVVEALIDNADGFYLPGDFITLRIGTGDVGRAVLSVPTRAVVQITREGGSVIGENRPAVWLVRGEATGGATKTEYYCTMHPEVVSDQPGICPKCKMDLVPRQVASGGGAAEHEGHTKPPAGGEQTEYYCTMHPEVVSDQPGICPKCKMDLVPRQATSGEAEEGVATRVPITVGRHNGDRVEVLDGLKPGDQVIVSGFANLRDGDRVRIVTTGESAPAAAAVGGSGRDRTPRGPAAGVAVPPGAPPPTPAPGPPQATPRTGAGSAGGAPPKSGPAAKTAQKYTCPMHPEVVSDQPGSCPKCGMELEPKAR